MWKSHCLALGLVFALAAVGRAEDVDVLRSQLSDANAGARAQAAKLLGEAGDEAAAAVPDLIEALEDRDASVRLAAIEALGEIRVDGFDPSVRLFGALTTVAGCDRENEAVAAITALVRLRGGEQIRGACTKTVIALLADPDSRDRARKGVLAAGEAARLIVLEMLRENVWRRRVQAVDLLGELGVADAGVVKRLAALADGDPVATVRIAALDALAALAPTSAEARDAVRAAAESGDEITRLLALEVSRLDGEVRATSLELAMRDESAAVRLYAVREAHRGGGPIEILRTALDDTDARIRYEAACALFAADEVEWMGSSAPARAHDVPIVSLASARVGEASPEDARVLAHTTLNGWATSWRERISAVDARAVRVFKPRRNLRAGGGGSRSTRRRPTLPAVPDPLTLELLLDALASCGSLGHDALAAHLGHDDEVVRGLAVFALVQLGPDAVAATSQDIASLLDTDVRYIAAVALAADPDRFAAVLPILADGAVATNGEGVPGGYTVIRDAGIVVPGMWRYITRPALAHALERLGSSDLADADVRAAVSRLALLEDPDEATAPLVARAKELLGE